MAWKRTAQGNWVTTIDGIQMFASYCESIGWSGWCKVGKEMYRCTADFRRQIPAYLMIELDYPDARVFARNLSR